MSLIQKAEIFFENHPLADECMKFTSGQRAAAVNAAQRDVAAELGAEDISLTANESICNAIFEQALFLLFHPEYLSGDRSFASTLLAPRAAALLNAAPEVRRKNSISLSRG